MRIFNQTIMINSLFKKNILSRLSNEKIFIVAYHNIVKNNKDAFLYDRNNVSCDQKAFADQLLFYKEHFNVIRYSEYDTFDNESRQKPALIITFDDGYHSFCKYAAPLLREHNLPATVFLSTDYVGAEKLYWWDEIAWICNMLSAKVFFSACFSHFFFPDSKLEYCLNNGDDAFKIAILKYFKNFTTKDVYRFLRFVRSKHPDIFRNIHHSSQQSSVMDWEQVTELSEQGFDFGSHTLSHCLLDMCTLEDVEKELSESKRIIEERLQKEVTTFCYPTGRGAQPRVQEMLRKTGYRYACLMKPGVNDQSTNPFLHNRLSITQGMTIEDISSVILLPELQQTKATIKAKIRDNLIKAKKLNLLRTLYPKTITRSSKPIKHVFFAICDHYEPYWGYATHYQAYSRVKKWVESIPPVFANFKDADGRPPVYSFFYPIEEYKRGLMNMLEQLQEQGFGEVEIHLHHDNDTSETLTQKLINIRNTLRNQHGMLATDKLDNRVVYGFIHGNWSLDNARSDGRWCGVNNEIDTLQKTGCYGDFTMPSAPSNCQTKIINSLYYAVDDPNKPRSHYTGELVRVNKKQDGLLMVQGPLSIRRNKLGFKIENSEITGSNHITRNRIDEWFRCGISVPDRPDWIFIKLHTHGTQEAVMQRLFAEKNLNFLLSELQQKTEEENAQVHFVSARQMANVILAIEDGAESWSKDLLDYRYQLLQ